MPNDVVFISNKARPFLCKGPLNEESLHDSRACPFLAISGAQTRHMNVFVHAVTQMREEIYQTLGSMTAHVAGFYGTTAALPAWAAALVGDLPIMPNQHLRLLIRHVITPLVKACPPMHR